VINMVDQDERYRLLRPIAPRGFESLDSDTNDEAREVMREEQLAPQGGEDAEREAGMDDLTHEEPRPLTHDEREAAKRDAVRPARVYAPASARVPKEPAPGDDRLICGD
jgi:hypothetical protein